METAFIVFMWIGAIGTSTMYWFNYSGTDQTFVWRRIKTTCVFMFWYVFLVRLYLAHRSGRPLGDRA
jgi:hypothetical protein